MLRFVTFGVMASLCATTAACLAVALVMTSACVTAPPPELPELPEERPTIRHESVVPPTDVILSELPVEFVVPVQLGDPDESFEWDVFVDYNPCADPTSCQPSDPTLFHDVEPTPGTLDGGEALVSFSLTAADADPSSCHRIDFLVAHQFDPGSPHTWDNVGGDIVTWFYNAGGGGLDGCPVYDAGDVQDGAFPPADAETDALPVVPESGTSDGP